MADEGKEARKEAKSERSGGAPGSALYRLGKEQIEKTTGKKWDKHHPLFALCLKTLRRARNEL